MIPYIFPKHLFYSQLYKKDKNKEKRKKMLGLAIKNYAIVKH